MVFAESHGEVFVERMDFEVGEGEGAHGCAVGVVLVVAVDEASVAPVDVMREKQRVRRVLVCLGKLVEIAFVPGALLCKQNLDAAEFSRAGSVQG